ncbi:MAG: glycosyltransferase family 4 protein, partial [Planctomycetota bacterium]
TVALRKKPLVRIRTKHNLKPIRDTFTNRYYYRTAIDWLIAPSKAARDHLLETPIVPGYKVVHIPNGIALDRAATFPGDRRAARRELGLPSDAEVVLYASRLSKNKDPATLVRAIQRISASRPRLHCLVAGDGSPEIRAEMERLLVAGSAVILLGQRDDVPRLLAAADLFVLPSVSESFGLAPLEAMLARVPVIVSDCPGFMDYVRDRENAVVFPRRDDAALAAEIDRLLDDPRLRRCLAAEGERTVLGYFNADRMIDDTERLYLKILGEGSGETLPATATALS